MNFKILLLLIVVIFATCTRADNLEDCKKICEEYHEKCEPARSSHGPTCGDQLSRCNAYCDIFGHPFGQVQALLNKFNL